MMVKKLAIRPVSPIRASSSVSVPSPKMALNPSNSGVAEVPMLAAPPSTPVLRNRMPTGHDQGDEAPDGGAGDVAGRVMGLLRASGSSSMAR